MSRGLGDVYKRQVRYVITSLARALTGEAESRARSLPVRSPAAPIRTIATGHAAEGPAG